MSHMPNMLTDQVISDLKDFDHNSGTLTERLLFNNRRIIVFLCMVTTLILGYQSLGLTLNAAFEKMIPTSHPYIANFLENRKELSGMGNTLRIAVEAKEGSIFDEEYLDTVRRISDEVFLLPGVDRSYMKSLWAPAVRWTGVTEDGLDGGPVIPDDYNGSQQSLEQVRINVERSGEVGQLVAENYRSSIILVPLQERIAETGERIDYHQLSQRIEQLRDTYESERISIHVTGFAKVVGDLIEGLYQVLVFFAAAIASSICRAPVSFASKAALRVRCPRSKVREDAVLLSTPVSSLALGVLSVLAVEPCCAAGVLGRRSSLSTS